MLTCDTYLLPQTLDEAFDALDENRGGCRVVAGSTDLLPWAREGRADDVHVPVLVDITRIPEMTARRRDGDRVRFGAATPMQRFLDDAMLMEALPEMPRCAVWFADDQIRESATIGGNIVNASPAADSPPALLAYDAELELASVRGRRWVPYRGFHRGYKQLACEPDELLTAIRMPRTPGGEGALHLYRKVGTRKAQAIAKVGLAALGRLDDGKVVHLRMALSSVGPTVLEADRAARAIVGETITEPRIEHAIGELESDLNAIDDIRSTAAYRRTVAANLVRDFLRRLAGVTGCGYGG
jgi:carbon-monoxide dehydrogenase medium subunit/xanthine dehydrogenase FAD-binding subunit